MFQEVESIIKLFCLNTSSIGIEPSLGLGPALVKEIFHILKEIKKEGTTVLIIEQNVKQTLGIADRAYVLENGQITLSGTGESLLNSEHVKTAYLGI